MQDIRLIALDMDGTVLDDAKRISPRTMQTLQAVIDRGVLVVPATGRPADGVPPQFMTLRGVRYVLASNGASVVDLTTGKQLVHLPFARDMALAAYDILARYDSLLSVFAGGTAWALDRGEDVADYAPPNLWEYLRTSRRAVKGLRAQLAQNPDDIEKFSILYKDINTRDAARDAVLKRFPDIEVSDSLGGNLELNAPGVDKGRGLLALAAALGLAPAQVMACGDGGNDLGMVRAAGLGVAMANAQDEVKAAANFITLSNNEDGVAAAVERFVLQSTT